MKIWKGVNNILHQSTNMIATTPQPRQYFEGVAERSQDAWMRVGDNMRKSIDKCIDDYEKAHKR